MSPSLSGDEFLNFLLKLNKQCGHLITAVQNIITELPVNSHKVFMQELFHASVSVEEQARWTQDNSLGSFDLMMFSQLFTMRPKAVNLFSILFYIEFIIKPCTLSLKQRGNKANQNLNWSLYWICHLLLWGFNWLK